MFDIKDMQPADNSIGDWWKYVLIVALILGIGVLIYWFIKTSREKNYIKKFIKPNRESHQFARYFREKELWQKR
jgi:hypothetical protein